MQIDLTGQSWTLFGWRPNFWHQRKTLEGPPQWQPDIGPIKATVPGSVQTALRCRQAAARLERRPELARLRMDRTSPMGIPHEAQTLQNRRQANRSPSTATASITPAGSRSIRRSSHPSTERSAGIDFDLTAHVADGKPHVLSIVFDVAPPEQGQIGATSQSKYFKPRYSYSWDWCPRFVPIGIWDKLWIEAIKAAAARDESADLSRGGFENRSRQRLCRKSIGQTSEDQALPSQPRTQVRGDRIASSRQSNRTIKSCASTTSLLKRGIPNGSGKQPLYDLTVSVNGKLIDERTRRLQTHPLAAEPGRAGQRSPDALRSQRRIDLPPGRQLDADPHGFSRHPASASTPSGSTSTKRWAATSCRVWGGGFLERRNVLRPLRPRRPARLAGISPLQFRPGELRARIARRDPRTGTDRDRLHPSPRPSCLQTPLVRRKRAANPLERKRRAIPAHRIASRPWPR